MKKVIALVLALTLVSALFAGCTKIDTAPEINVTAGDTQIASIRGLNKWNGAVYDRLDSFQSYLTKNSDLTYLPIGTEITIEFDGKQPDSVVLTDAVLTPSGDVKYDPKLTQTREITFKDGKGSFKLDLHIAANLSSNIEDYKPGTSIRGFKMLCTWGDNECEYAFIIRSDADSLT